MALTVEQNERLCRVGPGTPGGEMLRRYWHPIAATSELAIASTKQVRILGEDLVLYRDRSGRAGLIEPQCAHRRAGMLWGIPEEEGLRCAYHGWMYDATGQCIEQPYETFVDSTSSYHKQIKLTAYPCEELGGLIFAYLGPEPRPLLPRLEAYVRTDVVREIGVGVIPCNWFQTMENVGDASHVVYAHWKLSRHVFDKLGRPDLQRHEWTSGAKGFFARGAVKKTPYGEGGVVFPYTDVQANCYQIRVPTDDTHTTHIWYMFYTPEGLEELGVQDMKPQNDPFSIPYFNVPMPGVDQSGLPEWSLMDNNSGQDCGLWYTQGDLMDRSKEHLGRGDDHIIQMRALLEEQISIVEEGGDPVNTFRDPSKNEILVPHEAVNLPSITSDGRIDRTYAARKYSGIVTAATIRKHGERALADPVH